MHRAIAVPPLPPTAPLRRPDVRSRVDALAAACLSRAPAVADTPLAADHAADLAADAAADAASKIRIEKCEAAIDDLRAEMEHDTVLAALRRTRAWCANSPDAQPRDCEEGEA
nr:hypothetical protein TetV2_00469 [Oceanusvirus sp.]